MKKLIRSAALAVTLLSGAAAQATTFNFSYDFASGYAFTGSFDGTANGNLVTGLSNFTVMLNGAAFFTAPFTVGAYHMASDSWDSNAVVSFDGLHSNFGLTDGGFSTGYTHAFLLIPYASTTTDLAQAISPQVYALDRASETDVSANWHLDAVAAVPEPETYAMLLAGLGLLGFTARRRQHA
ncbi:PEP-CTERM sorting domain-containing protein [Duganella aceris]|uniref:PEP-CTERM sorting domain-containing protein n=1 Tax=Duganella aceris TaxID=2703883 RepID=UPI001E2F67CD|nr:PEP-CTERM sorting domain-containing protein [Duganella aceris]